MAKMTQKRSRTAQNAPKLFEINHKPQIKISYDNHPRGIVRESNSRPKVSRIFLHDSKKGPRTAQIAPKFFENFSEMLSKESYVNQPRGISDLKCFSVLPTADGILLYSPMIFPTIRL